jgi:hypothetical protein
MKTAFRNKPACADLRPLYRFPPTHKNHEIPAPDSLGHRLPVFHFMRHPNRGLRQMREIQLLRKLCKTRRMQGRLQVLQALVTGMPLPAGINA